MKYVWLKKLDKMSKSNGFAYLTKYLKVFTNNFLKHYHNIFKSNGFTFTSLKDR